MRRAVIIALFVAAWTIGPVACTHNESTPAPSTSGPASPARAAA